jgi:hypothetical protein
MVLALTTAAIIKTKKKKNLIIKLSRERFCFVLFQVIDMHVKIFNC